MVVIGKSAQIMDKSFLRLFNIITICSSIAYTGLPGISYIASTLLPIIMYLFLWKIYTIIKKQNLTHKIPYSNIIKGYLLWNMVIIIRGFYDATDYWDYKTLLMGRATSLLLPLIIFLGYKINIIIKMFSILLRTYLFICLFLVKKIWYHVLGLPLLFIIPFIPYIKKKTPLIGIILFIFLSLDFSARAWLIRLVFAVLLFFVYNYFNKLLSPIFTKSIFFILLIIPITLVILGRTNQFNVFKMDEYISSKNIKQEDIADTRSHLYSLVQTKLEHENKEIIGLGGKSEFWNGFYSNITNDNKGFNKKGRDHTESGLLNMYLYGGWINAILYSLLFILSSYTAIFKSNSTICKVLGIFIIFRWNISFIDEPEAWIVSNIILFITIGTCLSYRFRKLSDNEIKSLIKWYN